MTGFYLIDKPTGPTSHDIVDAVRRITGERRVGHAGTLDPFATGLLIVAVGREATKQMSKLSGLDKEYEATFELGELRDTDDVTGTKLKTPPSPPLSRGGIEAIMQRFVGEIEQMPPAYAAIKIKGRKMYEAARKGETLEVKARKVRVDKFELISMTPPNPPLLRGGIVTIRVRITCSSGTYIRAIARDMGGYVQELRRTKIGPYSVAQARQLESIQKEPQKTLLPVLDIFATLAK